MPNIKSAKKRVKVIAKKALQNAMTRSALRTMLRKYEKAVTAGDKAAASSIYSDVVKKIDQATAKGILHKNNAARKKSRYTKLLNTMGA